MSKRRAVVVLAIVALTLLAGTALGQVPTKMNYQVMLTDDFDEPLANQTVTLFFTLHTEPTGGTLLWSESHSDTTNSIGVVSVTLGETSPLVPYHVQTPTWMQVAVNGQTLSPRRELVSSPYALHASDSDELGALPADYYALKEDLFVPGAINTPSNPVDWTVLKNVPAGFADGSDDVGGAGDGHSLDADDGSPVDAVYVDADGNVAIGPTIPAIELLAGPANGGSVEFYEETGSRYAFVEPDFDGVGGYLWIGDGTPAGGFTVDGNYDGGNDARVTISGSSSVSVFNTYGTGNQAVVLPASAVSASEILDEPGAAMNATTATYDLTGPIQSILSRTVIVPAPGYVLAIATLSPRAVHTNGIGSSAVFGVSDNSTAFPFGGLMRVQIPSTAGGGIWFTSLTVQGLFEVDTAGGAYTFHLLGDEENGSWTVFDRNMTLVYLPTSYGLSAGAAAAPRTNQENMTAGPGHALTEANFSAERAEAEAFNNARIERELAAMEAEIAGFRASMQNGNKQ
ncbi:MAG: hypothetical protein ABIE42_11715 [Candidatus Eisenbacteria bacterium]